MAPATALITLVIALSQIVEHRIQGGAGDPQLDPAARPCEVDRTRALTDASRANPNDCRPRDLSPPTGSFRPASVTHGHVSFTTLTAPRHAWKAYQKASRELAKKNPNRAKAAKELEGAVRFHPNFAVAWYLLGSVRVALHQNTAAKEAYEQALAADPKYPDPYLPLAFMELKQGRPSEAARLADQVLKFYPVLTEARFYSAVAHYNLGEIDAAKQSISAIMESGDDRLYPRIHAMLGEILANEGDFPASAREYRRLLELDPDSRVAEAVKHQLAKWQAEGLIGEP